LETVDKPQRRATDKEFVEWVKRKKEIKRQKLLQWCETKWEEELREKSRAEENFREYQQKEFEEGRKAWEQFSNELEVTFYPLENFDELHSLDKC
jgi:hypothetical protein